MLGLIPRLLETAVELTGKVVVEAVKLPLDCGQAIWDGMDKAAEAFEEDDDA